MILTHPTQRARSSTARRGNSGFTGWNETSFCWEEFWDTVLERWNCTTISPHEYPSWGAEFCCLHVYHTVYYRHTFGIAALQDRRFLEVLFSCLPTACYSDFQETLRVCTAGGSDPESGREDDLPMLTRFHPQTDQLFQTLASS